LEPYELVDHAFKQLPPQELNRLLANRLESTPLAEFLADPRDSSQIKKLTRQHVRQDPAFAEELARTVATTSGRAVAAPAIAARKNPPSEIQNRNSNLATVLMSGIVAILVALLAVLIRKPRPAKRRNRLADCLGKQDESEHLADVRGTG
jgi:hypothetical protein